MIELSDYQVEAVKVLVTKRRHLLADDYGVGKSYPAIEAAWQVAGSQPKLIVCPAYLIGNWERYIRQMYIDPTEPKILTSRGNQTDRIIAINAKEVDWLIVSYTILGMANKPGSNYHSIMTRRWGVVIFDEAHRLRGRNSLCTSAAYRVSLPLGRAVFLLTADPVVRDAGDIFPLLRVIDPDHHTSYWRFVGHYCRLEVTPWARKVGALYNPEEFRTMLKKYMTRRLPSEVGLEFPAEMPTEIWCDLSPTIRKTYSRAIDTWRVEHVALDRAQYVKNGGALVHKLRMLTGFPPGDENPKLETVKGILEDHPTRHVAVYCWYKDAADLLLNCVEKGRPAFLVTGSIPADKRDDVVQRWKASGNGVLVATLGSLTEGANLQFCNHVVFYEEDWVPKTQEQALGRFIRRGSEFSEVYTWYLRCTKTVDAAIWRMLNKRTEQKLEALLEEILVVEES